MRVYTALPAPARRRSGRPLNASSLGHTNRAVGGSLSRCSWGFTRRPVLGVFAARLAAVGVVGSSSPVFSCGQHLCQPAACGLTRRCSGPAVFPGLPCSPGASPSSVWPAAERFFVRCLLWFDRSPPKPTGEARTGASTHRAPTGTSLVNLQRKPLCSSRRTPSATRKT